MKPHILITGGAGFVGSHTAKALHEAGYVPVVVDDLSRGNRDAVQWGPLEIGNIGDQKFITEVARKYHIAAAMHFAAYAYVGESVLDPALYYQNNLAQAIGFLQGLKEAQVNKIVFSSSCAVYGTKDANPISESSVLAPINPYGRSKLMFEQMLQDYFAAYQLNSISLRYFNVGGSDPSLEIGEQHTPETHLIPLVIEAAMYGASRAVTIHGVDYETMDGTCIRDYVHVCDIARAHLQALVGLLQGQEQCESYNVGAGRGYSVREVIASVEREMGVEVPVIVGPRRPGDPASLIADTNKAKKNLGWRPERSTIELMVTDAVGWRRRFLMRSTA